MKKISILKMKLLRIPKTVKTADIMVMTESIMMSTADTMIRGDITMTSGADIMIHGEITMIHTEISLHRQVTANGNSFGSD